MTDDTNKKQRDREGDEDRSRKPAGVKVTDKRMFGPDGELREEYSFLKKDETKEPDRGAEPGGTGERRDVRESGGETVREPSPEAPTATAASEPPPGSGGEPSPGVGPSPADATAGGPSAEGPGAFGQPSFLDLVSVLAEPVAIYLGDVKLPDGRNAENLDMARFHIDLLDILRGKTEGQLTEQEKAVLDDLLYRLRMRFVQKRDAVRSGLENRSNLETPG